MRLAYKIVADSFSKLLQERKLILFKNVIEKNIEEKCSKVYSVN